MTGSTAFRLLNGENRTGVNFGVRERVGTITGTVWNDANGDRLAFSGETGLADWTVYLDSNSNGALDAGETSTISADDGSYRFSKVPVGTWKVTEVPARAGRCRKESQPLPQST